MKRLSRLHAPKLIVLAAIGLIFYCAWIGRASAGGPPIPFDDYSVTDGVISANCPEVGGVQAVCSDGISDNGMLQRSIEIPSGVNQGSYIQFILTEPGVTGDAAAAPFIEDRGILFFYQ